MKKFHRHLTPELREFYRSTIFTHQGMTIRALGEMLDQLDYDPRDLALAISTLSKHGVIYTYLNETRELCFWPCAALNDQVPPSLPEIALNSLISFGIK